MGKLNIKSNFSIKGVNLSLSELTIQDEYRSSDNSIIQDFYIPCLERSIVYKRAVGFFSSTSMATAAKGLSALICAGGKMQLIASPKLSNEDIEAISTGLKQREKIIAEVTRKELEQEFNDVVKHRLACLAWLLSRKLLDIKLAIPNNQSAKGIYHEKLGIFEDGENNIIAFTGSANESETALIDNFECIDVFCSWHISVRERALKKAENFAKLWNNETKNVEVIDCSEALKKSLLQFCPYDKPLWDLHSELKSQSLFASEQNNSYNIDFSQENKSRQPQIETLKIPADITLRQHQRDAIRQWFRNSGQGILEMATGSGKTITALAIATKLYEYIGSPLLIVIICPYLHLVSQWKKEANRFGLNPLLCTVSRQQWEEELSVRIYNSTTGIQPLSSIITSNVTFASKLFQHQLRKVDRRFLLVIDEVHNLGSEKLRYCLPKNASYRLGLSATPERWFDLTGTEALTSYFGSTLVHYTLRKALEDKVLCPYRYYPKLVKLTDEEFDLYYELTKKIARAIDQNNNSLGESSKGIEALLIQRSRLIATAKGKSQLLQSLLTPLQQSTHNLIYCGDGTVETETEQFFERQIDAVTKILGRDLEMNVAKYTAETPLNHREELRDQFRQGKIQCLVAIRCLDEGVDIPEIRRAFILASSSNPRQFIQRRGRLLRTSPGKDIAEIFDFVVEPPTDMTNSHSKYYSLTRRLFGKELIRVIEFASLAINGPDALDGLLDLRDRLNLLDLTTEV